MKPPLKSFAELKPATPTQTYAKPSPKMARQQKAKVLSSEERAAFLASRPDLASKKA